MDNLHKELEDVKAAMEKLKAEYQIKTELSESLRKSYNEQLVKTKEAKLEIEKQAQELNAKAEEICVTRQMHEDLKSNLHEKVSVLRHLSSANDKLRADYGEKLQKLEGENRELVFALDEANMRTKDQEQKICRYKEEIEGLKGLLSVSQKKCFEAEQRAQAPKELRQRDDLLMKLEEENSKIKDQHKWKKEQFKHLEEAHEKLRDQFQASKKEWEQEKSTLLDELCSLQTRLDSQTRISEGLQSQLYMCNQALSQEETRRKFLEVQMYETKTCYENVFVEYQEAKSKIESLTVRRDEEIAALRNLLGTKETHFKEMEFRRGYLEQENQELRQSLKEFQEAQIQEAGSASSLAKLRNKLRGLERVHKDCSANLKAREVEWSFQMEKMTGDLNDCRSELDCKDKQIQELQMELEGCHSSIMQLKLENEEISVMLMVFKSGFSDARSKLSNLKVEMELNNRETDEQLALLMEQLEKKNSTLVKAHAELEHEREKAAALMRTIESSDLIEQQYFLMQKELEKYKEMLEESSGQQLHLKEQASQVENALKQDLRKVSDALDKANSELAEKTCEGSEIELDCKDKQIQELQMELEGCHSSIMQLNLENEEISVMLMVFKSGFSDARSKLSNLKVEMELHNRETEEQLALLMEQLQKKNSTLVKAHAEIEHEREKAAALMRTIESSDLVEQQYLLMQKELERYKEMLEESSGQQLHLKEQASQIENALKQDLRKVSDALDKANSELAEKTCEGSEIELDCKDKQIQELQMELEGCHSSIMQLKLENEEISVILMVFKSGFSDARSKLSNLKVEMELHNREIEEQLALLMEELEKKNRTLVKAHAEIEHEQEKAAVLMRTIESSDRIEQQYFLMQKELERYRKMLEESSGQQLRLKEQASQIENALKQDLRKVSDALDKANSELAEKTCEGSEIEFELDRRKSIAERLKACLGENQEIRREVEASLLAQVETEQTLKQEKECLLHIVHEKDKRIDDLQQHIVLLEQELTRRETETTTLATMKAQKDFEQEKESFLRIVEEKDKSIDNVQQQIAWLEQEFTRRESEAAILARTEAEKSFEQEKERLLQVVEEKGQMLEDLQQQTKSLELAKLSGLSELAEKQAEIDTLHEAWKRITTAEILGKLDIEVKNLVIVELEEEINSLQQKLELQEKSSAHSKQQAEQLEAALEAKQLEMEKVMDQLGDKLRTSAGLIEKLESEKRLALDDIMKLSSESRDLLAHIGQFYGWMSEFSDGNTELMEMLGRIVQSFDKENELVKDLNGDDELYDSNRENVKTRLSSSAKKLEVNLDGRSPLKECNN